MAEIATGARARFSLGGVAVGFATNVNINEEITYEPVEVLDNIQVEEFVAVGYRVDLSAGLIRIVNDTLKSRGLLAQQGRNPQQHLLNILNLGELVAQIEDSRTSQVIGHVEGVKISRNSLQITARGVVGVDVSFVAKRFRDESDLTN